MSAFGITRTSDEICIESGILKQMVNVVNQNLTSSLSISNTSILNRESSEFRLRITQASPNQCPKGISISEKDAIEQKNSDKKGTDGLDISKKEGFDEELSSDGQIKWISDTEISGINSGNLFEIQTVQIHKELPTNTIQLEITYSIAKSPFLFGLSISIKYEIYENYSVVRKWIQISNSGPNWLKIDNLWIDLKAYSPRFSTRTFLTPEVRGASSSLVSFSNESKTCGVILGSEIPSALRSITPSGQMGYTEDLFEWVIGPDESFESEPIWLFGFTGTLEHTCSHLSLPLDRVVETSLQRFFEDILGITAKIVPIPGPVWCSWSNLVANIDDQNIREMADIAAQMGIRTFQIDAGWAKSYDIADWTAGGTEPNDSKFPLFNKTCQYISMKNMNLGLWVSCFRPMESKDLQEIPDGRSLPLIKRGACYGMSFTSRWREYYVQDLVNLVNQFDTRYFKQDLTNIRFGDIAEGHESRTKKESYLRGLRGLLTAQAELHRLCPNVWTMLSHEIYWETPGPGCDLAIMKSTCGFHIPPNDYSGCGIRRLRWNRNWKSKFGLVTRKLRQGCFHARKRFYSHRGLPLYELEYYGAATINIQGCLTSNIIDRQICSWLMGEPSVCAGDLASLSPENITQYRKRFTLLNYFQETYDIYHYFQFSGVPPPTDFGWHWWGKLNPEKYYSGIVVIVRGWASVSSKFINVPWVIAEQQYHVKSCIREKDFGAISGQNLQKGILKITIPRWGQEILEISRIEK